MGTPPPTGNLVQAPIKPVAQVATGVVLEISGDRATVDIAGSAFQVRIPGSVLGVMEGRSVQIRSEGNSRTIVAMTTPLDPPNYSGAPDTEVRGATDAPPTITNPTTAGTFYNPITTWTPSATDANTLADINKIIARYANANTNWSLAVGGIDGLVDDVQNLRDQVAELTAALAQVRNKQDTMVQDFQQGTGILK